MTTTSFDLKLLSPSKTLASVKAKSAILPGSMGYMTILPDHAAMIAELQAGEVDVDGANGHERYFVSGGYVKVDHNRVIVLADNIEAAKSIDLAKAEDAFRQAQEVLASGQADLDYTEANRKLREAEARLAIAKGKPS